MRVVVREQPFNSGVYRIEVRRDRFLKVYVRHDFPHHRCERDTPIHDVLAHFLLARFALLQFSSRMVSEGSSLLRIPV